MSYRSRWERDLAGWALARGWRVLRRNGAGHLVLSWPGNGLRYPLPGAGYGPVRQRVRRDLVRIERGEVIRRCAAVPAPCD